MPAAPSAPAAASAASAVRRPRKPGASWTTRVLVAGAVLVAVAGLVMFSTMTFGSIQGEEFSPDDFTRRRFHYLELPLVRFQVTPVYRQAATGDLEKHLTRNGLVAKRKVSKDQKQWDLVYLQRGGGRVIEGDALLLCRYLDLKNAENSLMLLAWTKEHPALAKALWPAIAEAARRELYLLTPDLIEVAKGAPSEAELRRQVKRLLADKYRDFALTQQALERHEAAVALLSDAIRHASDDPELRLARAKSYDALNKTNLAAKDRDAAHAIRRRQEKAGADAHDHAAMGNAPGGDSP